MQNGYTDITSLKQMIQDDQQQLNSDFRTRTFCTSNCAFTRHRLSYWGTCCLIYGMCLSLEPAMDYVF